MTRTPDEIKKGLECCIDGTFTCEGNCVFDEDVHMFPDCIRMLMTATLALIQQLKEDNAQLNRCIENMTDKLNAMNDEAADLQAEIEKYVESADKCCYESQCNAELNHLEALCKRLKDENEQLQSERDAAVKDLQTVCNMMNICCMCKDDDEGSERCEGCLMSSNWQWRGVQKEG